MTSRHVPKSARGSRSDRDDGVKWKKMKVHTISNDELRKLTGKINQGASVKSVLSELHINTPRTKSKPGTIEIVHEYPKFEILKKNKQSAPCPALAKNHYDVYAKVPMKGILMNKDRNKVGPEVKLENEYLKFEKLKSANDSNFKPAEKPAPIVKISEIEDLEKKIEANDDNRKRNLKRLNKSDEGAKFWSAKQSALKNETRKFEIHQINDHVKKAELHEDKTTNLIPKKKQKHHEALQEQGNIPTAVDSNENKILNQKIFPFKANAVCLVEKKQKKRIIRRNQGKKATRRPLAVCEKKEFLQGEKKADH